MRPELSKARGKKNIVACRIESGPFLPASPCRNPSLEIASTTGEDWTALKELILTPDKPIWIQGEYISEQEI